MHNKQQNTVVLELQMVTTVVFQVFRPITCSLEFKTMAKKIIVKTDVHNEHTTSCEWIIMQQFQLGNNIVMHKFFDARESVCWYNTGTNRATFKLKVNLLYCMWLGLVQIDFARYVIGKITPKNRFHNIIMK